MKPPPPPAILTEEWDNPAMTEFKRLEAEDRVTFAASRTQEEWRALMDDSRFGEPFSLAPKRPRFFCEKVVRLPW